MEIILTVISVCLLIFSVAATLRLFQIKRELRRFSEEVQKLKDADYYHPIKLECFDKDITDLAVGINEHVELQHNLSMQYKREKAKLNNVISGISHDFRTPLTSSLGYLQMIKKSGELSEKNKEYLDIAVQKNKYLKELSDEFFELSKLESSKDEVEIEKLNLSNLVTDMIMEQYSLIEERKFATRFDIANGVIIESNKQYVIRIIQNLFTNAEKYAFKSFGVKLAQSEGKFTLTVFNDIEDKSALNVEKIFEPFYEADSRSEKGSGFGLYVVKCLSEKLGYKATAFIDENGVFAVEITS